MVNTHIDEIADTIVSMVYTHFSSFYDSSYLDGELSLRDDVLVKIQAVALASKALWRIGYNLEAFVDNSDQIPLLKYKASKRLK